MENLPNTNGTKPTITITLDPIKGPTLDIQGLDTFTTIKLLQGVSIDLLMRTIHSKEDRRILTAVEPTCKAC